MRESPETGRVAEAAAMRAATGFHLLAKPTGAVCNLDCSYCFFLSKEMLYPGARFRMADDLLEAYIEQLIEAHSQRARGADRLAGRRADAHGASTSSAARSSSQTSICQPGQRVVYTIQTNGTLLDEEWAAFFTENDFLVGISIDGPRELHDAYRVNKGGRGSFDQVMRGLEHLQAGTAWSGTRSRRSTRANAEHGREVYRFLRDECGASFVQFIPIIERVSEATDGEVPWSSWRRPAAATSRRVSWSRTAR